MCFFCSARVFSNATSPVSKWVQYPPGEICQRGQPEASIQHVTGDCPVATEDADFNLIAMNGSGGKKDKAVRWTRDVWRKGEWEWVKQLRWTDEMCEGKVSENELSNSDGRMRCVKKRWARTWRKGVSPERPGRTGGGKRADGQTRQKRRTTLDWVSWTPAVRVQRQRPQLQLWGRGFFPDVVGQGQVSWRCGST